MKDVENFVTYEEKKKRKNGIYVLRTNNNGRSYFVVRWPSWKPPVDALRLLLLMRDFCRLRRLSDNRNGSCSGQSFRFVCSLKSCESVVPVLSNGTREPATNKRQRPERFRFRCCLQQNAVQRRRKRKHFKQLSQKIVKNSHQHVENEEWRKFIKVL